MKNNDSDSAKFFTGATISVKFRAFFKDFKYVSELRIMREKNWGKNLTTLGDVLKIYQPAKCIICERVGPPS